MDKNIVSMYAASCACCTLATQMRDCIHCPYFHYADLQLPRIKPFVLKHNGIVNKLSAEELNNGNGVNLFHYPKERLRSDYDNMVKTFGRDDFDVQCLGLVLSFYDIVNGCKKG